MWTPRKYLLSLVLLLALLFLLPSLLPGQPSEPSLEVQELLQLVQEYDRALTDTETILQRWIDRSNASDQLLQKMSTEVKNLESYTMRLIESEQEMQNSVSELLLSLQVTTTQRNILIGISVGLLITTIIGVIF